MLILRTIAALALMGAALSQERPAAPEALAVDGKDALAAVDAATRSVELTIRSPDELAPLDRLEHLQHLQLRTKASACGSHGEGWGDAGADALLALRKCRALRSLSVGYFEGFDPACLHVLCELPLLDELELMGAQHLVDRALVSELAKLGLRRLALTAPRVMPDAFPALCELPLLEELRLELPLHIDRCDLKSLSRLRNVRRVELRFVGSRFEDMMQRSQPLPGDPPRERQDPAPGRHDGMPGGEERVVLDVDATRALASLPRLRELDLASSVVTDSLMATLPTQLTHLELRQVRGLTAAGVAALRRLVDLRMLGTDSDQQSAALAKVLPDLSLVELHLGNGVDASLAEGLAKCDELQLVDVRSKEGEQLDLDFLAELPSLRRVTLAGAAAARADDLRDQLGDDVVVVTR